MCSQIDKANVHPYNKAYYKYCLEYTGHWNSIPLKIMKGCLCCPMSVRNGETMRNISSGHIKMNHSCGEHKHSALLLYLQVNGKIHKLSYWLLFASMRRFPSLFHKMCTYKQRLRRREVLMASTERDSPSRRAVFNRNHKRAALHYCSVQCKQLRPKPLHSTTHLLARLLLIYSCIHVFIRTWRLTLPFSPYNGERMHFHSGMEIIMDPMKSQIHICFVFLWDRE